MGEGPMTCEGCRLLDLRILSLQSDLHQSETKRDRLRVEVQSLQRHTPEVCRVAEGGEVEGVQGKG